MTLVLRFPLTRNAFRRVYPLGRPSAAPRPHRTRARVAVAAFPVALAVGLVLSWSAADLTDPARLDPEYLARRTLLRARRAELPGASLVAVLGSSRISKGFLPEAVPAGPGPAIWFNLSHSGAGPAFTLVILDRALRDGLRPDVVVFEVMPTFATRENPRFVGPFLSTREAALAGEYLPAGRLRWHAFRHRYLRPGNLSALADPGAATAPLLPLGGQADLEDEVADDDREARVAGQWRIHGPAAREVGFTPASDRAVRAVLGLCRSRGIQPIVFLAPESTAFRGWYDPPRLARFEADLAGLCRDEGARLIDGRGWLPDDAFTDGHHPLRRGAVALTARLMRAVQSPG